MAALLQPEDSLPSGPLQAQLRLALQHFPGVRLALLFGSQARGRANANSDVDVAVLAARDDLLALTSALGEACGREVDVVGLDDPGVPLLEELLRDARLLYERDPGAYAAWRSRALTILDIDGPGYTRMRDAWLERVARHGV